MLSYHGTGTPEWGANDTSPAHFVRQIELATRLGYRFVSVADVASGAANSTGLAISFDDGLRSILSVVPYLQSNAISFTVFVVTGWADSPGDRFLSWAELGQLREAGATVGSHSLTHPNFRRLSTDQQREELERSREKIERELGAPPQLFAIPFGRAADWDEQCTATALEAGYRAIFAQAEALRPRGTIGRSFVSGHDGPREFRAILEGRFDRWQEWIPP